MRKLVGCNIVSDRNVWDRMATSQDHPADPHVSARRPPCNPWMDSVSIVLDHGR